MSVTRRRIQFDGMTFLESRRSVINKLNNFHHYSSPRRRWLTPLLLLSVTIYLSHHLILNCPLLASGQSFRKQAGPADGASEAALEQLPVAPMAEGPGVDLLAFNRRRFELDHHHGDATSSDQELRRGQSIEADLAALSNRLMAAVPGDTTKQLLESFNVDSSLITGPLLQTSTATAKATATGADPSDLPPLPTTDSDPDGASIARLTKSCLTVHASSARPDQLDVKFYLYTSANPRSARLITPQTSRAELLGLLDPRKPLKWITHGFHTNVDKSEWMVEAKDKILAFEDANVILTDWRRGASPALAFYPKAAANAHVVAKFIVRILRRLRDDIDLSQVHLIGHSLGAHIMGFVGSAFTEEHLMRQQQQLAATQQLVKVSSMFWRTLTNRQPTKLLIGRITACDPALPCFGPSSSGPVRGAGAGGPQLAPGATYRSADQPQVQKAWESGSGEQDWTPSMWTHLRPDSAIIVEVMHSNPGVMGYMEPLGDFDFYPNGLERQPGCGIQQQQQQHQQQLQQQLQFQEGPARAQVAAAGKQDDRIVYRRMKRQWSSVLDGFMSTIVHPLVSSSSSKGASEQPPNTPGGAGTKFASYIGGSLAKMGESSSRFSQTIDRFLNPIKSFFKGNTCSHHRSVEYMVESLYYDRIAQSRKLDRDLVCQMVGYRCKNYESFKKGFCFRCSDSELDCRAFGMTVTSANQQQKQHHSDPTTFRTIPLQLGAKAKELLASESQLKVASRQLNLFTNIAREKFRLQSPISGINERNHSTSSDNAREDDSELSSSTHLTDQSLAAKHRLLKASSNTTINRQRLVKRILPTFDHYSQSYQPQGRNLYFFDTRPNKSFCLHHYHIHVKYRWLRVRESLTLDGFRMIGTLANLSRKTPIGLHKFTHNSYTALLDEPLFLGQIESLMISGAKVKANLIEYIEITFMSNLDPKVRALGSARLCRAPISQAGFNQQPTNEQIFADPNDSRAPHDSLFVRCSGPMVK